MNSYAVVRRAMLGPIVFCSCFRNRIFLRYIMNMLRQDRYKPQQIFSVEKYSAKEKWKRLFSQFVLVHVRKTLVARVSEHSRIGSLTNSCSLGTCEESDAMERSSDGCAKIKRLISSCWTEKFNIHSVPDSEATHPLCVRYMLVNHIDYVRRHINNTRDSSASSVCEK
jgi:hypothetical protein